MIKFREVTKATVGEIIRETKGRFCTIGFWKADGTFRVLNGRIGVKKYLKGGRDTHEMRKDELVVLYDVGAKGYRSIRFDSISYVRSNHFCYVKGA